MPAAADTAVGRLAFSSLLLERKDITMLRLMKQAALTMCAALGLLPSALHAQVFRPTNLVTDDQSANTAKSADTHLKNGWGISYAPTGPFWLSNNGTGTSTLYRVNSANAPTTLGLVVTIPGDGSVTGQAFNGAATHFNGDNFLFVSEDGTISGWRGALGTAAQTFQPASSNNVYKGAAIAQAGNNTNFYAANFHAGTIDAFQNSIGNSVFANAFKDPSLPAGYAPFNIQNLNGTLYVTYALQDSAKHDEVAGLGNGFVDAFDLNGNLLGRVGSGGTLDAPWGLAIAPSSFGSFAGDLLVGNFGDGTINAFNLATDTFAGQLLNETGNPLVIDGLWALIPGNNGSAGNANTIYFSAGPNGEAHGLFGSIQAVPEPGSVTLAFAFCLTAGAGLLRRRRSRR